ncbi:hypothetical protein C0993_001929 [Termitomyces sp. T159_Od127]|nr:hypothetical protein C0993_001929 [Termitomyces sp. T159_Od127]
MSLKHLSPVARSRKTKTIGTPTWIPVKMSHLYLKSLAIACFLVQVTSAAPAVASLSSFAYPGAPDPDPKPNPRTPRWGHASPAAVVPEPIRGKLGANILGPQNPDLELQNVDLVAPPPTDHGRVDNLKWPFAMSHNRLSEGGWARQQNVNYTGIRPQR